MRHKRITLNLITELYKKYKPRPMKDAIWRSGSRKTVEIQPRQPLGLKQNLRPCTYVAASPTVIEAIISVDINHFHRNFLNSRAPT